MTDEILEKAKQLKKEIETVENLERNLRTYFAKIKVPKKRSLKIVFRPASLDWEYSLPREIQMKLWRNVRDYLQELNDQYDKLGKEEEMK